MDDYGRNEFKEIGKLSSMLPAYVRHCCRSMHDGTDVLVLDEYRNSALKVLNRYRNTYAFVRMHFDTMHAYEPSKVIELIRESRPKTPHPCQVLSCNTGLPKRACLHCSRVGGWIEIMHRYGHINEKTGERYGYK